MNIAVEAGIRLFWQCAHCGHHTHTSTYPTFVTLCENCEAPRAANVALVAAYTPASSSRSSALPSRKVDEGDRLRTSKFHRREPIVSVFASEDLCGVQSSSATTERCDPFSEGGNNREKSSLSGHHVTLPPSVGRRYNMNNDVGTTTSTCSGATRPSPGGDETASQMSVSSSSPSDLVIAARIPQDEAKFLCPQPNAGNAAVANSKKARAELLRINSGNTPDNNNNETDSNVNALATLIGRHFDPISFNSSNHWAKDQTHRRLRHHHQNGQVTTTGLVCASTSSSPPSPVRRGDSSSPASPSSPHLLLSSPLHHAALLSVGGASAPTDIVSQTVLSEAHRFGITSIPAPFPLNFTLVPWHVHDSRVPLSEIRAAAPAISSEIQIQEVTESVKLRWWRCWSSPPPGSSSPPSSTAYATALPLPSAADTSSQMTIVVGDHVKLCCTTKYYYYYPLSTCISAKEEEAMKARDNNNNDDDDEEEVGITDTGGGLLETAGQSNGLNGCHLPIPSLASVGKHRKGSAPDGGALLTAQEAAEREMNNGASLIPVAVQDISITLSRMGIATAVRSDRRAWRRGEEVGVVGGLVLFASDPRIRERRISRNDDEDRNGHFQKEGGTNLERGSTGGTANITNPTAHHHRYTLEQAILDAVRLSPAQTKTMENKTSSVCRVPIELCGAAHNPHVSSCFSSSSSVHSAAPAIPPHKAFFAIPLPHTSIARTVDEAVTFGRSPAGDQIGIGSGGGGEMVLLPTNEFAHIGVVPNKSTKRTGNAVVPPLSPSSPERLREPGCEQRALPFLRNAAFVADPNAKPNITFVTSMDHLGCVFVAAVALAPISHTTELLVSESEVIMFS